MIKFELPTLKQEFINGELKSTKGNIDCYFDMSAAAQITWEREFPAQAEKIALFDYVDKLNNLKIKDTATAITALKVIYCFLVFEKPMSVLEFLRMFSFSDKEYFDELVGKLKEIMSAIFPEDKKKG